MLHDLALLFYAIIIGFTLCGLMLSVHAVMHVRTSEATIAWCFGLIFMPYITVFAYLILGRNHLKEYASSHKLSCDAVNVMSHGLKHDHQSSIEYSREVKAQLHRLLGSFNFYFTHKNNCQLLVNAAQAYPEMLAAIASAQRYILLQSYIIRNDDVGRQFQQALIAKKHLEIYVLYDEVGSVFLDREYLAQLTAVGINVSDFGSTKRGILNRFRVNFRNHRKLLVCDGEVGFMGGLNIGDEYVGKNKRFGAWRDTHLKIIGPAVSHMQLPFMEDWYWANQSVLALNWQASVAQNGIEDVMILPHGPQQEHNTALLTLNTLCYRARQRIWLASPYFVPESSLHKALLNAALRGVDVRLLLPNKPDHKMVYLCSYAYYSSLAHSGVKLYRYQDGFMHQKVWLFDDELAAVGTTNLDNRSLLLNFEMMALNTHSDFIYQVASMLTEDFKHGHLEDLAGYRHRSWFFRFIVSLARLFAPIL